MTKVIHFEGHYDDEFYWERVDRNLGWLGNSKQEQRACQEKLRDSVIGIVGTGGIGGAVAARLVRMGALNLKLADAAGVSATLISDELDAGTLLLSTCSHYPAQRPRTLSAS